MHIVHVHVHVQSDRIEPFRKATRDNASASLKEPGIARFDVIHQVDDPTRFVLVEVYRDRQAPSRHRETPHYAAWRQAVEDWMVEPRTRVEYDNVFPEDSDWG